jgi:membrane protease YdiL (CAAX protease family)
MWLTSQDASQDSGEAFWGYRDLALFFGLAIPCLLVAGPLIAKAVFLTLHIHTPHKALELLPGQFLGYALLYWALAFLFRTEYERPFWSSLGWRWPRFRTPSIIALGFILAFSIAILGALLRTPEGPTPMEELLNDRASLLLVAAIGVTLGPLCEELAFRGLMQPLLIRSFGVAPGIFLAALGFGLLHLPEYGNHWQQGVLITLAGVGFGWMRQVSGSTLASTLMHSAYNLILFLGFIAEGSRIPKSW